MARVAVIILNWNGEKLLREFLPSVVKYTDPGLGRIVVADNASEDDSVRILEQEFPEVELIRFSQNHGFAGAAMVRLKKNPSVSRAVKNTSSRKIMDT